MTMTQRKLHILCMFLGGVEYENLLVRADGCLYRSVPAFGVASYPDDDFRMGCVFGGGCDQ